MGVWVNWGLVVGAISFIVGDLVVIAVASPQWQKIHWPRRSPLGILFHLPNSAGRDKVST